jgi:hypothetical protein
MVIWRAIGWSRLRVAVVLALVAGVGLTLCEVIPQYQRWPHRGEHPGRLDDDSFLIGDGGYYRAIVVSLLHDHDLDVRNDIEAQGYPISGNVSLGRNGQWYPKHSIFMPLVALPFYAVGGDIGLLAFNVAQVVALLLLMWAGARRYSSESVALAVALWFAFGTTLRPAAYNFAPDVLSSVLVLGGILAALSKRSLAAGVLMGLAVWAKWTNAAFLPIVGGFFLFRRQWRSLALFVCGTIPPVVVALALNVHMFGSPFTTPYDRVLVEENGAMVLQPSHRTFFTVPFWKGLWTQLTDKNMGLVESCPPFLLALPGLIILVRRSRAEGLLLATAFLVPLATFAKYDLWWQSSYGPRFLMTTVAISALAAAPVVQWLFAGRQRRSAVGADGTISEPAAATPPRAGRSVGRGISSFLSPLQRRSPRRRRHTGGRGPNRTEV